MAVGLTGSMNTAKSSLLAMQEALSITSNNIANSTNSSYHKQSMQFSDNVEILDTTGYYGTGVSVSSITRSYSTALETSLSAANSTDGYNQTYLDYASQVEDLIAPDGDSGIMTAMSSFMKSMQDVQTNPEDSTYRNEFISAAQTLADDLNASYTSLGTIRSGIASSSNALTGELTSGTAYDSVDTVNSTLQQLASLNDQISNLETYNSNKSAANDLRDERDSLVKTLSSYMSINVSEDAYGRYTITTADNASGNVTLLGVTGTGVSNYQSVATTVTGYINSATNTMSYSAPDAVDATVHTLSNSGELGAYADAYGYVSGKMNEIYNTNYSYSQTTTPPYPGYAQAIATETNAVLEAGYDLDGNTGTANDLFAETDYSASNQSVLSIASGFTYRKVAASSVSGEQGNGNNMGTLWNYYEYSNAASPTTLYSSTASSGNVSTTLGGYANEYVNNIAQTVSTATSSAKTSSSTVTMYKNAISAKSGVSSDDELTNMLALQQAYAASGKLISTIQSMYDAIFSVV